MIEYNQYFCPSVALSAKTLLAMAKNNNIAHAMTQGIVAADLTLGDIGNTEESPIKMKATAATNIACRKGVTGLSKKDSRFGIDVIKQRYKITAT